MEKMVWERPEMNEVAFAANEYVSLCLKLTCTLMGDYDWYDVELEHGSSTIDYGDCNGSYGKRHDHDMEDIHQKNQCGVPGWYNTVTKAESGSNGAAIGNVWLNTDGDDVYNEADTDLFVDNATEDQLRSIVTSVGAMWESYFMGSTWYHKGTAVFEAKNANNS